MATRRRVLASVAGVIGTTTLAGTTVADHRESLASHVSLRYDQGLMEQYRPLVIDPPRPRSDEQAQGWYGWIAESPEYDYTVYVYFMYYQVQRDGGVAGHRFDREPCYVFVDDDTGDVREIAYSAYHWLANQSTSPPTTTTGDGGEHPTLRIIAPYNHYVMTTEPGVVEFPVSPLGTEEGRPFASDGETTYETWLATGWEDSLAPGVVTNPARMRTRDTWWRDGRETLFVRSWAAVNLTLARAGLDSRRFVGGAAESDLT